VTIICPDRYRQPLPGPVSPRSPRHPRQPAGKKSGKPVKQPPSCEDKDEGSSFLEADADLRRYRSMFDHLRATALSATDTSNLLASTAASMKGG